MDDIKHYIWKGKEREKFAKSKRLDDSVKPIFYEGAQL